MRGAHDSCLSLLFMLLLINLMAINELPGVFNGVSGMYFCLGAIWGAGVIFSFYFFIFFLGVQV